MWNLRLYALTICVGLLARSLHRAALHELDGEIGSWAGLLTFWIPVIGLICIGGSILVPVIARKLLRRGG